MEWSPDGTALAVATLAGPVLLLDGTTGQRLCDAGEHRGGALAVAWTPGGLLLASSGQDGRVRMVGRDGRVASDLSLGSAWVEHLAWSDDGELLAAAAGKVVHAYSRNGREVFHAPATASTVASIAWMPKSHVLGVAGYGGIQMHPVDTAEPPVILDWKGSILLVAPSPDGRVIATGNQDASVHLWQVPSLEQLEINGFATKVRTLAWSATGHLLAAAGGDSVTLWPFTGAGPTGTKPKVLKGHKGRISGLCFLGVRRVFAVGEDGLFVIWEEKNGRWAPSDEFEGNAPLLGLAVDCMGRRAAVSGADASLAVFELTSSEF
jgi:WD40 repeat protein